MVPYIDVPNLVYICSVIKKTHTQVHVRKKNSHTKTWYSIVLIIKLIYQNLTFYQLSKVRHREYL